MRTCEFCGKPLTGQREHYCSDACRVKALANDMKAANAQLGKVNVNKQIPQQKKCVDCGVMFPGYATTLRCPDCRIIEKRKVWQRSKNRRARGKGRAIGSISQCVICGQPYKVRGGRQLYCPDCAKQLAREKSLKIHHENKEKIVQKRSESRRETYRKVAETRTRVCPACGKTFTPSQKHHVYCSKECAAQQTMSRQNLPATAPHISADKPRPPRTASSPMAERRVQLGLTQSQLAQKLGVSLKTIWNYEHGVPVSARTKQAIEAAFQSPPDSET